MIQKQLQHKKILPVYAQKEKPRINSEESKANSLKFPTELKQIGISAIR
jgi:hypothetical protein